MRRIDPEFRAAVVKNSPPGGQLPRLAEAATERFTLPRDTRTLTRGVKSTLRWDQIGSLSAPVSVLKSTFKDSPSRPGRAAPTDRLDLSEEARRRRGVFEDPAGAASDDLDSAEQTLAQLLAELKRRGLAEHPRARALTLLQTKIAHERKQRPLSREAAPTLREDAEDLWERLLSMVRSPERRAERRARWLGDSRSMEEKGDERGATRTLERLIALDPNDSEAHARLGKLLLKAGDFDAAAPHLEAWTAARPRDAAAHIALGELHYKRGDSADALGCFAKALRLVPEHSDANAWLGILAHEGNRPVEAQRFLERAIAFDPNHAVARFYLAQVSLAQGDKLRADYQLDIVRRLEPKADLSRFDDSSGAIPASTGNPRYSGWVLPRANGA